jgi:hypothetical protein
MLRHSSGRETQSLVENLESRVLFSGTPLVMQLAQQTPLQANTVPGNGDQNPYGVAFVPRWDGMGKLVPGDLLVSNFNDSTNTQGTGSTIVQINPHTGKQTLFFQGAPGLGLTTALGILANGDVIVGNLPADSSGAPAGPGGLLVINHSGKLLETITDSKLQGPWDLQSINFDSFSTVFVSNVLSGTVSRLEIFAPSGGKPALLDDDIIAKGFLHRTDPNAFVIGPTGVALNLLTDTLYVASTGDNAIFGISNALFRDSSAGMGSLVFSDPHLRGPLALGFTPNGDLITANGDAINTDRTGTQNSELVEFTPGGKFVGQFQVDPAGGAAFGFASEQNPNGSFTFAAVDDATNQLDIWNNLS